MRLGFNENSILSLNLFDMLGYGLFAYPYRGSRPPFHKKLNLIFFALFGSIHERASKDTKTITLNPMNVTAERSICLPYKLDKILQTFRG